MTTAYDLEQSISERHSMRKFLLRALVGEALALAQHAPSNSNIQPWRMVFASGAAQDRLRDVLLYAAWRGVLNIPALPEAFRPYRQELGAQVYGLGMGTILCEKSMNNDSTSRR
jgi:nitroreductase